MNKKVYLIRHGDVENPKKLVYPPETSLSSLGRTQLHKVAELFKSQGIKIDALFVSPFARAKESAMILQQELAIHENIIIDDLSDVHPNSWVGKPLVEYGKIEGDIYGHPQSSEQETLNHLLMRAKKGLEQIVARDDFNSVGIVSHGDLISGIDWILRTPDRVPTYIEMKNRFYLQKGQVAEYTLDPSLKILDEVKLLTIPEVKQSLEGYRYRLKNS